MNLSPAKKTFNQHLAASVTIGLLTGQLILATLAPNAMAQVMFAGVTDIDVKSKSSGEEISFKSDLPFQYEVQTLNPNQVLIRLHNARLSEEVLAKNGVLNVKPSKNVKQGVIRVNDASNIEEIVLSGPGLGGKKITVNGADELRHADDIIQMPMIAEMERQNPTNLSGALPEAFGLSAIADAPRVNPTDVSVRGNQTVTIRPAEFDPEYDAEQRRRFLERADQEYRAKYQADTNYTANGQKSMVYFPNSAPNTYRQPVNVVNAPMPQYTPWQQNQIQTQTQTPGRIEPTTVLATTADNQNTSPYPMVNTNANTSVTTSYTNPYPNMASTNSAINRSHAPTQRSVEVYHMLATEAPQPQVNVNGIPRLSQLKPTAANNMQLQGIGRTYAPGQPLNNYLADTPATPQVAMGMNTNTHIAYGNQEAYAAAAVNEMPQSQSMMQGMQRQYEPAKSVPNYKPSPMLSSNSMGRPITYTLGTSGQTYQVGNPYPISAAHRNEVYTALNYADTHTSTQAQANAQLPVENVLYEAVNAYKAGNYQMAEEKIEEALEMDQNNADIYQALAEIKVKQGQTQAALTAYEKAMSINPQLKNQRYAELLILADQKTEAVKVLEMLAPNNNQPSINYMLGTLYEESGQMDKAVMYLEKAATQKPNDLNIQYNLGLAYEYQGNIAKAKVHYQKAAQINPNDVDVKTALTRVNG